MTQKNLYIKTTITTIFATIAYSVVQYFLNSLDIKGTLIFIIVFWIVFFFVHKYFDKKTTRKRYNQARFR